MALWWVGNVALLAVVTPVVVVLLRRVVAAAAAVRSSAEEIGRVGRAMAIHLEAVGALAETQRLVGSTTTGLVRYGRALDEIL